MNDLTGKKVYIIIENDKELDQGEDLITVEAFSSMIKAKETLNEEGKTINFIQNEDYFADVNTDDNRWHWEIQSPTIQ